MQFCHAKASWILHGRNLHHPLYLSIPEEWVAKAGRTAERCYKIVWEVGVVETQINNEVKSVLEKQLSDKYHPKSNKQIEEKYLESNHV